MRLRTGGTSVLVALVAGAVACGCTLWEALSDPWNGLGEADATPEATSDARGDAGADAIADSMPSSAIDACAGDAACTVGIGPDLAAALAVQGDALYALATNGDVWECASASAPACDTMARIFGDGGGSNPGSGSTSGIVATTTGAYWTVPGSVGGLRNPGGFITMVDGGLSEIAVYGTLLAMSSGANLFGALGQSALSCSLPDCMPMTLATDGVVSNVVPYSANGVAWAQRADGGSAQVILHALSTPGGPALTTLSGPLPYFVASDGTFLCWFSQQTSVQCCTPDNCFLSGGMGMATPVPPVNVSGNLGVDNALGLFVRQGMYFVTTAPDAGAVVTYGQTTLPPMTRAVALPRPPLGLGAGSSHPAQGPTSTLVANSQYVFYIDDQNGIARVSW